MAQERGILLKIFDTQRVSEKYQKRDFVVKLQHMTAYPQEVLFQLSQDKCDIIDPYPLGVEVIVDYNLKGRKWTNPQGEDKWFDTVEAWKIQPVTPLAKETAKEKPKENLTTYDYKSGDIIENANGDEDLPF